MPNYVCLVTFTQEGLKNLKATTKRAKVFQEKVEAHGIKIKTTLWTVGRYDLVHILEAPNDEVAASMAFSLGALGNVRTETLRAFDIDEMEEVLEHVYTPYDLAT